MDVVKECLCLIGVLFSRDRQREQISQAISDALQSAISREMEHGSTRMRSVIESVNEDIKREMTTTLQEASSITCGLSSNGLLHV